jgi:uncharacterized protein YndB with AHSA1/START domain
VAFEGGHVTNDPVRTARLVTRQVRTGRRGDTPTRTTAASRLYRTDQRDLWDAVTNVERIPRWFVPITGRLELGGRNQLEGNAGGTIEACDEPESFAVTWEFGGSVSWVSVSLTPVDGGTRLEVTHESPADPTFWAQYGPGATGLGWDLGLIALDWHTGDGAELGPDREAAFAASPEGAAFLEAAGTDWADAAVADGDDHDVAIEAAQRSVAFYVPSEHGSAE